MASKTISKKVEIVENLLDFVKTLLRLRSQNLKVHSKFKLLRKNEDWFEDYTKRRKTFKALEDIFDSNYAFITYALGKYEVFLTNLLKFAVQNNKESSKSFYGKWTKFLDEIAKGNHKNLDIDGKFLSKMTPKVQRDNFQTLINENKTTTEKFLRDILGINKTSKKDDRIWRSITYIIIYREIRNLVIHRGEKYDQKFFKSLNTKRDLKLNSYLQIFFKDRAGHPSNQTFSKLLDKDVRVKFGPFINDLILCSVWYTVMSLSENRRNDIYISDIFSSVYHEIIFNDQKDKGDLCMRLYLDLKEIKNLYLEKCICGDVEKFNTILADDFYLPKRNRLFRRAQKNEKISEKDKKHLREQIVLNKQILSDNFDNIVFENKKVSIYKDLLRFYLLKDKKNFLKELKNISDDRIEAWTEWFIFQRYKNDTEFQKIYKKKKRQKVKTQS
tara:strand:- start:144 stop:1472 length:1329 start_codon:yes stop_codon:yes gene_type:complete